MHYINKTNKGDFEMSEVNNNTPPVDEVCPAVGYQSITVCAPVTVTPHAEPRTPITKCCGDPTVTPGARTCEGTKNGTCTFTISQDICVAVPVDFSATAEVKDTYVTCNTASAEDICTDCDEDDE